MCEKNTYTQFQDHDKIYCAAIVIHEGTENELNKSGVTTG